MIKGIAVNMPRRAGNFQILSREKNQPCPNLFVVAHFRF